MRRTCHVLIVLAAIAAGACTEQTLPVLGAPFPITVPAGKSSVGPRLAQASSDGAILSWMERGEDGTTLTFSKYELGDWQPAMVVTKDASMFVNWADRPAVTPSSSGNTLFAHWLSYSADATYAYDVMTARSSDGGLSWSDAASPHDDGTPTEHGFVSVFPLGGETGLIWLDGRKMANESSDDPVLNGMTLRGATIAADGSLSDEVTLDELVCDCCQTDVAVSAAGPVTIYRDRTPTEVRDIYVARHQDGKWQAGVPISNDNWVIAGCPVNGPAIAANGDLVATIWFSAADDNPVVRTAVSKNAGKAFSEPVVVASKNTLGSVGVALVDSSSYAVSWLESDREGTYDINVRTLTVDGQLGPVQTVGRSSVSRNVPQMRRVDDNLILAWADKLGDADRVVSIRVPILGFYD